MTALPHELEGYIIDLLEDLNSITDVEFAPVTAVHDGKYGSRIYHENIDCNGMIEELRHGVRNSLTLCV